jgi:site-specific recombinase XerD
LIESISVNLHLQHRHLSAPLVKEREQYLTHLLKIGYDARRVRAIAGYLVHVVNIMELTCLPKVELIEIEEAAKRWAETTGPERIWTRKVPSPRHFATTARQWFRFHGALITQTSAGRFNAQLEEFKSVMKSRGLAPITIGSNLYCIGQFLRWASERHDDFSLLKLKDVDDYLAWNREAGLRPSTIAGHSYALREFFKVAEERDWCPHGISRRIAKPKIPACTDNPKGPSWADVRRVIRSVSGKTPSELRKRALFLLFSVYGLRVSEVVCLRLDDFDWRNETFCVHRAKRGGIQQFPIQFEVGEAILDYLRDGRPQCACRNVFLTLRLPYRPLGRSPIGRIVRKQMKRMEIQSEQYGPHSLRHMCATRLLKKGSSLQEIADFLGHRSTTCVSTYAKFDRRCLRKVADFSLARIL